jgi:hypothetical protein
VNDKDLGGFGESAQSSLKPFPVAGRLSRGLYLGFDLYESPNSLTDPARRRLAALSTA